MKVEILTEVKAKPLVLTRVKHADEVEKAKCLAWLRIIRARREYFEAKQRNKELPVELLATYKVQDMMDFPEVKYRKEAFKVLRKMWEDTMPEILRRKKNVSNNGSEVAKQENTRATADH